MTTSRPQSIIPLPQEMLPKSSLCRIARAKIRTSFENGEYHEYEDSRDLALKAYKAARCQKPATSTERIILDALHNVVEIPEEGLGVQSSIFKFGVTSTNLFTLKRRLERELGLSTPLSVGTLLTRPTVRGIASELEEPGKRPRESYDPVVPLQHAPASSKTPLWLVHPDSGHVLVFVALARYLTDRKVYGLRIRGLNTGIKDTDYFDSIASIAEWYTKAIISYQAQGPYAVAGYSLGSTVAFEIAKNLEVLGHKVAFLRVLDSPPHMRCLIAELGWYDTLLNVAYCLELMTEEDSPTMSADLRERSPENALEFITARAPPHRVEVLAMDRNRSEKITAVTAAFGEAGKKYDPEGVVQAIDVFWVTPLQSVASSRQEWMEKHSIRWKEFSEEEPRFHECEGKHSLMLNAECINSFQKSLKAALVARGI